MLDNVIDINYYAVPQAKNSNMKHRPVGMGIMGFQDALYEMHWLTVQMQQLILLMNRWK
jgi:ribonucleoside-diphosphate reductase alpha chain